MSKQNICIIVTDLYQDLMASDMMLACLKIAQEGRQKHKIKHLIQRIWVFDGYNEYFISV